MNRNRISRRVPAGPLYRDVRDLYGKELNREKAVHVPNARVVIANYTALCRDFPYLGSEKFLKVYSTDACSLCQRDGLLCTNAIDKWLVENAAIVSLRQTTANTVNSQIEHAAALKYAYRPPAYGRALVVPVDYGGVAEGAGLFDLKGAGVAPNRTPSHKDHSNGLEYLGVAIADFFYGWLIDRIFARTVPGYSTVPVYAVLDLGFDITGGWHGTAPAGLHVRRAHRRTAHGYQMVLSGSENERVQLQIEMLLRTFGLTSANCGSSFEMAEADGLERLHFGGKLVKYSSDAARARGAEIERVAGGSRLEMMNIQLMHSPTWEPRSAQMYDFGHISTRKDFLFPFASTAQDRHLEVGHVILPEDASFIRPNPRLRVDPSLFHRHSVNAMGFYLAQGFRNSTVPRDTVENAIRIGIRKALRKS